MNRTIHMVGDGPRISFAAERLRGLGRRVVMDMAETGGPCVWILPYPFRRLHFALLDGLPRGVGGYVISGGLPESAEKRLAASGFCCYNAADEEFLQDNARLTAEGAVYYALRDLPYALRGCPVLVVGYGRIGQALARLLKAFGADVTVSARRDAQLFTIEQAGLRSETTGIWKNLDSYRCIFQTVPQWVFTRQQVQAIGKDCRFYELASPPYGMEPAAADLLEDRYILASGLPGKTAPESAGAVWAQAIERVLEVHHL